VNVTNEGDGAGTQDITYDLENDAGLSQLSATEEDVQLDAGASQEVTFEVAASDTDALSTGNYTHVFASDDDELTVDAEVVEPTDAPQEWTDAGLSADLFNAVDDNGDGEVSRDEIRALVSGFVSDGEVNGVAVDRGEVRSSVQYFVQA
jgi:hypothetical protein